MSSFAPLVDVQTETLEVRGVRVSSFAPVLDAQAETLEVLAHLIRDLLKAAAAAQQSKDEAAEVNQQ